MHGGLVVYDPASSELIGSVVRCAACHVHVQCWLVNYLWRRCETLLLGLIWNCILRDAVARDGLC